MIANTETQPAHRIRRVSILGGFLDGAEFEFAGGLNCFIGARGAGKTTVVELIRYALDMLPKDAAERRRIETLVERNLAGGRVQVTIETKDGLQYVVSRVAGDAPIVQTSDGEPTEITLANGGLFRADIFSQNQVERIADRTTSQLSLIDNFEPERIAEVESQLAQVRSELAANANQILPLEDRISSLAEELGSLPGVEERLKKYSAENGRDTEPINRAHTLKSLRDREGRAVSKAKHLLQDFAQTLDKLNGNVARDAKTLLDQDVANGPNGKTLETIQREVTECGSAIDYLLREAGNRLSTGLTRIAEAAKSLHGTHQKQELGFRTLIEQHEHAQGQAAERAQLERRRNELLARSQQLRQSQEDLAALLENRTRLLARRSELLDERYAVRRTVADRINESLSPAIRVTLKQCGNPECYQRLLEDALKNARLRHLQVAQKIRNELWPHQPGTVIRDRDTRRLVDRAQLSPEQAEKVMVALSNPAFLLQLETVELLDQPRIELRDGDTYKDSLAVSTGQKCTAVLPILLLDSDNPLLVDQPEDNLDNRFIFEAIVDSIRKIKSRRQMIFVTHNPNIPVLGDAERVFVLDSNGTNARKATEGTVDECKTAIVTLLEGGEDAFKARKCRYAY